MAIDVYAAQQREAQRQRRQAEDLEVDPDILRQPEGDVDIGQTAENKKQRPGEIQTRPDLLWQGSLPSIR